MISCPGLPVATRLHVSSFICSRKDGEQFHSTPTPTPHEMPPTNFSFLFTDSVDLCLLIPEPIPDKGRGNTEAGLKQSASHLKQRISLSPVVTMGGIDSITNYCGGLIEKEK